VTRPLLDSHGEKQGAIETIRDITELKMKEEELQQKMEELSRANDIMIGRELKMVELKEQIAALTTAPVAPPAA
jgi:transcriptional regulator with PAS, ATPase and Fis domain